jgi:peptidoglycan/xylan/chitin deacetylase (PgdA/CDA1 family)
VAGLTGDRGTGDSDIPVILMYHSVTPYEEDPYRVTVSPARFEQQMRWLHGRGLRGASVEKVLDARASGRGQSLVGLTFDDGYADFVEYALPVLKGYGFSATVYVIAGRMGTDNAWDPQGPRKPLLTAEQVRQVADAGIEIGSHGLRHVPLAKAPDGALAEEIDGSRRTLQAVSGQDVPGFCYPYGDIDGTVVAGVRAAGYGYGCAHWPSEYTGRYALPRTVILESDSPPRLWAKGVRHWLTWGYRGPGAGRLNRVVGDYRAIAAPGRGAAWPVAA